MTRSRAVLRIAAAVVFVGGVVGAGTALPRSGSNAEPPRARSAPALDATMVCPESRNDDATETDVAAVALPRDLTGVAARAREQDPDSATPSGLALGELTDDPAEDADSGTDSGDARRGRTDQRGVVATSAIDAEDVPPLVANASGALAPGATTGQLARTSTGDLRGLAETPCVRPGSEFWFVGAGSQVGRHGRLYLTNAEQVEARVNVSLYDETGALSTESVRNVALAPDSQQILELDEFAPTSEQVAVHVDVVQGRAAAALRDDLATDGVPLGVDWIPPAASPDTEVVVPAVAPGEGRRELHLLAPGDLTASVDLSLMGAGGTFQPMQQGALDVEPGAVTEVDLTEVAAGEAVAVKLSSDEPVVASVRNEFGPADGRHDIAYSAGASPLTGPAVIPHTPVGDDITASLLLSSAGTEPGRATVTVLNSGGEEVDSQEVTINAGGTVAHELELPDVLPTYTIMVTPEDGSTVYGSRLLMETLDEPLASMWPLETAPTTITQPAVSVDPRANTLLVRQ